jgi:hypothetical protein
MKVFFITIFEHLCLTQPLDSDFIQTLKQNSADKDPRFIPFSKPKIFVATRMAYAKSYGEAK